VVVTHVLPVTWKAEVGESLELTIQNPILEKKKFKKSAGGVTVPA
jgi:hypothetical protein